MSRGAEVIRIPRLRAVVLSLASLVIIGLGVFFRRYRGADRTAMALSMLVGAGICLMAGLACFHRRFGGGVMPRRRLWAIGTRCGALAGAFTSGVGIVLLAVRWALDQQAGPAGDPFLPAFLRALRTLGLEMSAALFVYLAVGAVVGGLCGLAIAEAIGISAAPSEADAHAGREGEKLPGGGV